MEGSTIKIPKEEDFIVKASATNAGGVTDYKEDGKLFAFLQKQISEFPELSPIADLEPRIWVGWKRKGGTTKGKRNVAKIEKVDGKVRYFAGYDFMLWIGSENAFAYALDDEKINAAIFNQLKCLKPNKAVDAESLSIVDHEFSGSIDELTRFGAWREDLVELTERMTQLPMFEGKVFRRKKGGDVVPLPFPQASKKNGKGKDTDTEARAGEGEQPAAS